MNTKNTLTLLIIFPGALMAQQKFTKTWEDTMLKSDFVIRYTGENYTFKGEKYEREGEFGTLAEGTASRIKQVVSQMDSALQSKDPDKLFALGRYKYTYKDMGLEDLMQIEVLKIEDLLKDEKGKKPVYIMSAGTLTKIKEFVGELE